jgi:hypothetical protein
MASIPGPIIRFSVDAPQLSGAVQGAMQQIRQQSQQTGQAVAEDWKRYAAQIRASVAQGALGDKEILALRQQTVSILDKEITGLRTRNDLTKQQLANLKAMTLEFERQSSLLKGGPGLTAGTQAFLGQVGGIGSSLVSQLVGRLGANIFGVAGGSQLGSLTASGLGSFGPGLSSIVEEIGPASVALVGLLGTMTALGAAAAKVTIDLAEQNQQIENTAAVTGLSTTQVQIFNEAARQMGLESSGVVTSIARFQAELGEYVRKGHGANDETIRFVAGLKDLGIAVEASGKLRDPVSILSDLSDALHAIPDPAEQSARGLDILGVRGRELLPILLSNRGVLRDIIGEIKQNGPIIGEDTAAELDKVKTAWDLVTEAMKTNLLQFQKNIASGFLSSTGLGQVIGSGPTQQQLLIEQARKAGSLGPKPGESFFLGTQQDQEALIKQAQEIVAGSKLAADIEEKRKEYAEAIKNENGVLALSLAGQIKSEEDLLDTEKARLEAWKAIKDQILKIGPSGAPTYRGATGDQLIQRFLQYGTTFRDQVGITAPDLGAGIGVNANPLAGLGIGGGTYTGPIAIPKNNLVDFLKQINDEHEELFTSQFQKDQQHYQDELKALDDYYATGLQKDKTYWEARSQIQQDWQKTLNDLNKKYDEEAGALFDDLVSGKMRQFGKTLTDDIKNIVLAPIKNIFDQVVGGLFGNIARTVAGPFQGTQNGGALGFLSGLPIIGGLFGAKSGGGISGGLGGLAPTGTPTNPIYVAPASGFGGVGGGSGIGTPSFLGPIGDLPFTAQGTALANALLSPGAATSGSATGGGPIAALRSLFLGGGSGVGFNGAAIGEGPSGFSLSNLFSKGGLGGAGLGIGGGLLMGVGARQGGGLGALEGAAGGAATGFVAGGPVGAIIGAAIGGITDALAGPSFQQQVATQAWKQAYYAPPSETFSFASNGSIANTLGTGFAQSGNKFSQFGLPANTPFYASAITGELTWQQKQLLQEQYANAGGNQPFGGFNTNPFAGQGVLGPKAAPAPQTHIHFELPGYLDASGAEAALMPIASKLSQIVSSQVSSSSSGFGYNSRRAVNLP